MHNATIQLLRERLAMLSPTHLEIEDQSHLHAGHAGARSGGGHFQLLITADAFTGQSTVARHRLVYDAAGDLMRGPIHALAIHARAPGEV